MHSKARSPSLANILLEPEDQSEHLLWWVGQPPHHLKAAALNIPATPSQTPEGSMKV
eukprot:CAMPEP_0167818174 /NCGR_PEP_ID=MMETSP0112_2-20121227/4647_1 /TAXON_ID=91324 /ORGANISM="Lotharella globosa, Strain CCCM811" /LENGTH=56 /DNA_ID=CAMNT_0007718107 /DNA_START=604 /DNA_END=774 /DNA_ORIENTATION=-